MLSKPCAFPYSVSSVWDSSLPGLPCQLLTHSFILNKRLLSTHYVAGTVLGTGDKFLPSYYLTFWWWLTLSPCDAQLKDLHPLWNDSTNVPSKLPSHNHQFPVPTELMTVPLHLQSFLCVPVLVCLPTDGKLLSIMTFNSIHKDKHVIIIRANVH